MARQVETSPGVLITFIPTTRKIDVIGVHPRDKSLETTLMMSGKRNSLATKHFEQEEQSLRYVITSREGTRTTLTMELKEVRHYGQGRRENFNEIRTSLLHVSFDDKKPSVLPENSYDVKWREDPDGHILELTQQVEVKHAYTQKTQFDTKSGKTLLKVEFEEEDSREFTIDGLMIVHRISTPPTLWPDRRLDPRYFHTLLTEHIRTIPVEADSKLQLELDNVSRSAHVKSCEICVSDYSDLAIL